ncbi:unknown [Phocaeicola coprophilus CAG:333]|nr:unknown [Phocaeicola coprophilus CAG:333]
MDTLLAPMAFNTPIMFVRSNMIMSNPDIMVKPATPVIKIRITQTFVSSNPSQSKI